MSVHIDDGRAFLERTDAKYDLILFALPDSLTLVSGHSSLRLESYLFTTQAMEAARRRLKPGGAFAMYNFYREPWLVDRLAGTLEDVYGHAPCVDTIGGAGHLAVLTVAPPAIRRRLSRDVRLAPDRRSGGRVACDRRPSLPLPPRPLDPRAST